MLGPQTSKVYFTANAFTVTLHIDATFSSVYRNPIYALSRVEIPYSVIQDVMMNQVRCTSFPDRIWLPSRPTSLVADGGSIFADKTFLATRIRLPSRPTLLVAGGGSIFAF